MAKVGAFVVLMQRVLDAFKQVNFQQLGLASNKIILLNDVRSQFLHNSHVKLSHASSHHGNRMLCRSIVAPVP